MLTAANREVPQDQVNAYFESASDYWKRIYETRDLLPLIYQARHAAVLKWVAEVALPRTSQILEIGCGAGVLTRDLARMGYSVEAVDAAPTMVELTRRNAIESGVADRVCASVADVHELHFPERGFDLVIAVGVIPWLHDEDAGLIEMQRVLKRGGFLIVTADNEWRLNRILDPLSCPLSHPLRSAAKLFLRGAGLYRDPSEFQPRRHTPAEVDRLLRFAGLQKVNSRTIGFGPFTIFRRPVVSNKLGTALHIRLQALADSRVPPFHLSGTHYLVLCRHRP